MLAVIAMSAWCEATETSCKRDVSERAAHVLERPDLASHRAVRLLQARVLAREGIPRVQLLLLLFTKVTNLVPYAEDP